MENPYIEMKKKISVNGIVTQVIARIFTTYTTTLLLEIIVK